MGSRDFTFSEYRLTVSMISVSVIIHTYTLLLCSLLTMCITANIDTHNSGEHTEDSFLLDDSSIPRTSLVVTATNVTAGNLLLASISGLTMMNYATAGALLIPILYLAWQKGTLQPYVLPLLTKDNTEENRFQIRGSRKRRRRSDITETLRRY